MLSQAASLFRVCGVVDAFNPFGEHVWAAEAAELACLSEWIISSVRMTARQ